MFKRTPLDLWLIGDKAPLIAIIWEEKESRLMKKLQEANDIVWFLNRVEDYLITLQK